MRVDEKGYSTYGVLNLLLGHARWFVVVPLVTAALTVALTLLFGNRWVAESTFAPGASSSGSMGRLASLASQFGVSVPLLGESEESVDFYVRLTRARVVLESVVREDYAFPVREQSTDTVRGNLSDLYRIDQESPTKEMHQAVERLGKALDVEGDVNAGVVTVRTRAKWAGLAEQLNRSLLTAIDEFNQQRRQAQAAAERTFLENRLGTARAELTAAEGELARFLEGNRRYEDWPALRFQYERLRRDVDQGEQLIEALSTAYEEARLEEVRNTPVIAVLDPPEGSARRPASLIANAIWGAAAGAMLVLLLAFGREYARRERSAYPDDYEAFEERRRALLRVNGSTTRRQA